MKKYTKEELKKADEPEIVKFENVGDEVSGEFVEIKESVIYEKSYALSFLDSKDEKLKVIFVNNIAYNIIERMNVVKGEFFILTLKEKVQGEKYKYNTYELYVKR